MDLQWNPDVVCSEYVFYDEGVKTSLNIDDSLYEDAKKASARTGKTLSDTISQWARLGRNLERRRGRQKPKLAPADLGRPLMNIDSRDALMDSLDDDRT